MDTTPTLSLIGRKLGKTLRAFSSDTASVSAAQMASSIVAEYKNTGGLVGVIPDKPCQAAELPHVGIKQQIKALKRRRSALSGNSHGKRI